MSHATRAITLAELYFRKTGFIAPGFSAPPETGEDTSSAENCDRFRNWVAASAFNDALDAIAALEERLRGLEDAS